MLHSKYAKALFVRKHQNVPTTMIALLKKFVGKIDLGNQNVNMSAITWHYVEETLNALLRNIKRHANAKKVRPF